VPAHTLIVPTFNRPRELARLLTCLARLKADFPVLVLDSSDGEVQEANRALAGDLPLDLRLVSYPSAVSPFEKFWRGSREVLTDLCSICADDDVVLVEALALLASFLGEHRDFSAAHGLYYTFYDRGHIGLTSIVYAGRSLDQADAQARLLAFFRPYEAVTYALYRAEVMRSGLERVQPVRSLLARELLAGALAVVAGKIARLPVVYYGRSLHPSFPYQHWHPIDFLISSPQAMLDDYTRYRRILLEGLAASGPLAGSPEDALRLIDLVHLRYLTAYVDRGMMDYLLDGVRAGTPPDEIMRGVWPRLAAADSPTLRRLWSSRTLGRLRARLAPGLRRHHLRWLLGGPGNRTVRSVTAAGQPREYRLYDAFRSALERAGPPDATAGVDSIVRHMNCYG
jgi:glycosyltransferase domain-containing protein